MSAAIEPEPYTRELLIGYRCYLDYKLIKNTETGKLPMPKIIFIKTIGKYQKAKNKKAHRWESYQGLLYTIIAHRLESCPKPKAAIEANRYKVIQRPIMTRDYWNLYTDRKVSQRLETIGPPL